MAHELFKLCNSRTVVSNSLVNIYGTYDVHAFAIQSLTWWPALEAFDGCLYGRKEKVRKTRMIKKVLLTQSRLEQRKGKTFSMPKEAKQNAS